MSLPDQQITAKKHHSQSSTKEARIMLFDLSSNGHHPSHILYLLHYWISHSLSGRLFIVVEPQFLKLHPEIIKKAQSYHLKNIQFISISDTEIKSLTIVKSFLSRRKRALQEWKLVCKYAQQVQATQIQLMYFDTFQLPLLIGQKPPCPVSGTYFRPRFHYHNFQDYHSSIKEKLLSQFEKKRLFIILKKNFLKTLFCLDPFVSNYIAQDYLRDKTKYLPDPVLHYSSQNPGNFKEKIGIDSFRKVFLLFGALDQRKGLFQLLEALQQLENQVAKQSAFLLIGKVAPQSLTKVTEIIAQLNHTTQLQIILENRFVKDEEMQFYFSNSDIILAPYQQHVGMSGIQVRAAAAGKPVLSSDYGLMGELTDKYKLGLTIDSSKPAEIVLGIKKFLNGDLSSQIDYQMIKKFADHNTAENFANVIFSNLIH
ncbi:MAG: glycosyltransferase [Spirochaetes bacterium]|nr:glycosyltransferase [Spirochaetota bacterium]